MLVSTLLLLLHSLLSIVPADSGIWEQFFGKDDVTALRLSNGQNIPLVGLEVGHIKPSEVHSYVSETLGGSADSIRLFDTSRISRNERELASGIVSGVRRLLEESTEDGPIEVHVVTKVWYTHLGYERTMLSIRESIADLDEAIKDPNVDLKIHLQLHWPRCYAGIEWMDCDGEEYYLSDEVKQAGPPPTNDKQNAWKESWRALEDIYSDKQGSFPPISSIGVANFKNGDMKAIMKESRIRPHIVQVNVWSLLHDPTTVNLCHRYNSHLQVFDVMNGIIARSRDAPHASGHLWKVAHELSGSGPPFTTAEVVFKWLTQYDISSLTRDKDLRIHEIPALSENHLKDIGHAVEAILSGSDMEDDVHVQVTFHAQDQDMVLFFYPGPTDEDELMISYIKKGSYYQEPTHPKHQFRLYSAIDPEVYHDYIVPGFYGDSHHVMIDLSTMSTSTKK